MKIATFVVDGWERPGAVVGDEIIDLSPAADTVQALIEGGEPTLARARHAVENGRPFAKLEDVKLLAPLPRPVQIRDCLAFEEHLKNAYAQLEKMSGRSYSIPDVWYKQPIYYKANRMSVIGPEEVVRWPSFSEVMDYELEMACIIGKTGTNISVDSAPKHIFGYTIFNDMTARDAQAAEMAGHLGPAKGKDFDTGNILGPWIVTADEIGDARSLAMEVRVNGERRGGGSSGDMHHSFEQIISFISRSETLYAGEVIGSGTVGTGCGLEIDQYLKDGDVIELEIEKIGVLRNTIRRGV